VHARGRAKRERKTLHVRRVAFDLCKVIRHHHAVVADLLVNAHGFQHVDVAIVNECFLEIEETASDVPEMHIKDLLARAEIPDHIEDLLAGFLQHLRNRALAEIQAVIPTIDEVDKALQAVDRSEDRLDALEPSSASILGSIGVL
jgi:hypothetical protein